MNKRIIRTGEYSSNNNSHFGSGCIFLGIGEYEEKRKYYENQRKLECQQYLAQQAQKRSAVKMKNGPKTPALVTTDAEILYPHKIDTPRKHVATQTITYLTRDAATYTELDKPELVQNGDSVKESFVIHGRKQSEALKPRDVLHDKANHLNGPSSLKTPPGSTDNRVKKALNREVLKPLPRLVNGGILTDILNQNINDIGAQEFNTKNTRRRWIIDATSYAGDLNAQVEEKRKIKRELEEKEKQEELARDKWIMEEDERHKEMEKHKIKKDSEKEGILTDTLNKNGNGELELNANSARRRWIDNATSYAEDLHAQVEEKNKIRRELEEKEKQEELARDKWIKDDDERHKEELEKSKAKKNIHQKTMEDLSHHQEQIRKDNEEIKISETRQGVSEFPKDILASDINEIANSSKGDDSVQSNLNAKRLSNKSFKNDLMPCQGSDIFRNGLDAHVEEKQHLTNDKNTSDIRVSSRGSITARESISKNRKRSVSKPASARLSENGPLPSTKPLPKSQALAENLGKEDVLSDSIEEKVPGDKLIGNLRFFRKQLEIDRIRFLENAAKQPAKTTITNDS